MLGPMIIKIIVIGDSQVGKTSLSVRYAWQKFQKEYIRTIGSNFFFKNIQHQGEEIRLIVFDLAGDEVFRVLRPLYYNGSLGCLLLFDVTRRETFEDLSNWIEDVRANFGGEFPILLLGHKIDVEEEKWEIMESEIRSFAEKFDLAYTLTSAKTGQNISRSFEMLVTEIIYLINECIKSRNGSSLFS